MNDPITVLVVDDDAQRAEEYSRLIKLGGGDRVDVSVATLIDDASADGSRLLDLRDATRMLEERTAYFVAPESVDEDEPHRGNFIFDRCDVVVIDNDLEMLEGNRPTAEVFLGQIRAFTDCSFTVVLNKSPEADFDLNLKDEVTTKADLGMNKSFLELPWLWNNEEALVANHRYSGFRPSYWPAIVDAVGMRHAQLKEISSLLDESIAGYFELDADEVWDRLSRNAVARICPGSTNEARTTTFRKFFRHSAISLREQDRKKILGDFSWEQERGLSAADADRKRQRIAGRADDIIARVVAAELSLWLQRDVLGPQDPLVDLPHLLERMPFLLCDPRDELEIWNGALESRQAPFGLEPSLYQRRLARRRFPRDNQWLGRDAWYWPMLDGDEELAELMLADETYLRFFFCEDTSRFELADQTQEFVCDFNNIWDSRHIRMLPPVEYAPKSRLAR
jgi:hypothetical protein